MTYLLIIPKELIVEDLGKNMIVTIIEIRVAGGAGQRRDRVTYSFEVGIDSPSAMRLKVGITSYPSFQIYKDFTNLC